MNRSIFPLLFICVFCASSYSQDIGEANIIGTTLSIQSSIMNDEREIQIYLPDGYSETDKAYPVLYLLDGQRYFLHAVGLQQSFKEFKQTPEFIIVGISKKATDRNRNFSSRAKTYLEFIQKEVIERIDSQLRTTEERLLFGWAFGGGFVLETMISSPDLFDAYIAASPFPLENKMARIDSLLSNANSFPKLLFFTSGQKEGMVKKGTNLLNDLLSQKTKESTNWTFIAFEEEEHRSTPYTTLYHGIRSYFQYYPELQFSNLEAFNSAGGLAYTYDYYKKRADQYGFSADLSDWTMFSITRNAIRADEFEQFDSLVNAFSGTGFISRLRVGRACSIAEYYLSNNQYEKAKELYLLIAEHHPKSPRPLKGLGDTYSKLNDTTKANSYYEKAEALNKQ